MNLLNVNKIVFGVTLPNDLNPKQYSACPVVSNGLQVLDDCVSFGKSKDASKSYAAMQVNNTKFKAQQIWNEIDKAQNIIILTHKNADGDAVGSGLALKNHLNNMYPQKNVKFLVPAGIPSMLKGIPGSDSIVKDLAYQIPDNYLAIAVDSDERTIDGLNIYKKASKRINIDHHESNVNLNHTASCDNITLISTKAPSATDVLYNKLFKPLNMQISEDVAECLLTGLLTDTGAFKHIPQGSNALETKKSLLEVFDKKRNFTVWTIMDKMDENRQESSEINSMFEYLTSKKMINTVVSKNGKSVNYIVVSQKALNDFNVKESAPDIKNKINGVMHDVRENAPIALVLWELEDGKTVKASMRSDDLVVKTFSEKFDGGGHAHAAGFTLKGTLDEVIETVISEIKSSNFYA